jgi:hypothetical protein
VVEYFNKHAAVNPKASATDSSTKTSAPKASKEEELKSFDAKFVNVLAKFVNVDKTMLFGLILAANYLNVKDLLDLTCQHAVDLIKDIRWSRSGRCSTSSTTSCYRRRRRSVRRMLGPLTIRSS